MNQEARQVATIRVAMLSPIAWRTPPRHYGPWERIVSLLTEGLLSRGIDVTLFATQDSMTEGRLCAICPRGYEEDPSIKMNAHAWSCLHVAQAFERASDFDVIHNHFDYLAVSYSALVQTPLVTTIHGFSSQGILPVYRKYNRRTFYVSISDADRHPDLEYAATIHHGIDVENFTFRPDSGTYLLFFGRLHGDKGAKEAIQIARGAGARLILAGIIQDEEYFAEQIEPHIDGDRVAYVGSAGPRERDMLLGGAQALLHPIQFEEPFGLSVIEAMACGTPVIAFERGSMREIIRDEETGFLVHDVDQAIAAVRRVSQLSRETCRRHVETRFTAERMVEDYLEIYERIASKRGFDDPRPFRARA